VRQFQGSANERKTELSEYSIIRLELSIMCLFDYIVELLNTMENISITKVWIYKKCFLSATILSPPKNNIKIQMR